MYLLLLCTSRRNRTHSLQTNLGEFIKRSKPLSPEHSYNSLLEEQLEQSTLRPFPEKYNANSETERRQDRSSNNHIGHSVPGITPRRNLMWDSQSVRVDNASPTFNPVETASQSSEMSLTDESTYRMNNLALNNIYLLSRHKQFPEDIMILLDDIGKGRDFSGPSISDLSQGSTLRLLS